ncbi:MAG: hypothetical protein ACREH3_04680 [Geminicoccales bacterium]
MLVRSEHEAREAFGSTLERSAALVAKLEALVGAVDEMSSGLRAEVEDVTESLRAMQDGLREWPEREDGPPSDAEPERAEVQPPLPAAAEPSPGEGPRGGPDPHTEPSPELIEMFREQITKMRDDGKSRDEAERVLLRFRLGHRFLGMLDDVYSDVSSTNARKTGLMGKLRNRS